MDSLVNRPAWVLAMGVITGWAVGRVVPSLVSDLLMPVISLGIPSGDWRSSRVILSKAVAADGKEVVNSINYGAFAGTIVDFIIVAFAVFLIVKWLLTPEPAPATKNCPFCLEAVPVAAKKCKACTSAL